MASTLIICAHCGLGSLRRNGDIARAARIGAPIYCNRECAGLARRCPDPRTDAEKRADKAAYDRRYRVRDPEAMKAKKRAYHLRTYDPAKAAVERKAKMPRHLEYCRQPAYRAKKSAYDLERRAGEFGEYAEAWMVLRDLHTEISQRASRYEIYTQNGTLNKSLQRKRDYAKFVGS